MQSAPRWHRLASADAIATTVSLLIEQTAHTAIQEQGEFKLVLAGGSTPEKIYALLAQCPADWSKWKIFYGDERCLPSHHPDRNSMMAERTWLAKVPVPKENILTIAAELGNEMAASAYQPLVAAAMPFDLALLGLGEDGHTASLFPGHPVDGQALVIPVYNSPKPPAERVSLGLAALNNTRQVIFIVTGSNKQSAVQAWQSGQPIPAAQVNPACGVDIYIDQAALPE